MFFTIAGWLAGWLACWLAGWLAGAPKCVKNAYPQHENASKTRTLRTKVRQKRVPLGRKSFPKRGGLVGYGRNPKMILSQICIDFGTKTYRFGHISGPSYRGAHAGWPAGWLVGWLVGWLAGWGTKMRQKRVPLARKSVENAYP